MDISTAKLQQLVAVARTGSFSKAAIELNISQPALSRSIAGVESRYGFTIFNRLGHGVELTPAGAQVIEQARSMLQTMRVFENNLHLFSLGKVGALSIGMAPLLASQQLAEFAAEFIKSTMNTQLKVLIRPGGTLVDSLKSDLIEMFFFPEGYIEIDPEITIEPIGEITPLLVVRNGHPLLQRDNLTLNDLAEFPWASSQVPPIIKKILKPTQFVCDNYHILRDAVLQSDLVCICTSAFVTQQLADGTLHQIQVDGFPLPATKIYVATLLGRVNSPLAINALQHMRAFLQK